MLWNPEIESPASIAIIGGGHLAIEAALYARFLGYHVDLFEAWRLAGRMLEANEPPGCSWRDATSSLGRAALEAQGVATELFQQDSVPDLRTWVDEYLFPLARTDLIFDSVHIHSPVLSISRLRTGIAHPGLLADGLQARAEDEFRLMVDARHRGPWVARADIIIDCSGLSPSVLGCGVAGGLACGENHLRSELATFREEGREGWHANWKGRRVVVVGGSESALRSVQRLSQSMDTAESSRLIWCRTERPLGTFPNYESLANQTQALIESASSQSCVPCCGIERIQKRESGIWDVCVALNDESSLDLECDVLVSYPDPIPDWTFTAGLMSQRYLRDEAMMDLEGGEEELGPELEITDAWSGWRFATAEPNYYVLGAKRYWPGEMPGLVASRRDIRDLFALIGGRRNLDLYRQFAPDV